MIERHMTLTAGDANLETRSEVLLRQKKSPASIIPPMNIMGIEAVGSRHIHIWLLIGSGVIAAGQIGKAIISLPLIRSEMAVGFECNRQVISASSPVHWDWGYVSSI